jgi:hypothetical protein
VSTLPPEEREVRHVAPAAVPTEAEKRAALEQVLASAAFVRAEQLRSFLRYICEMEIAGRGEELSEYRIGVEALGKPPGYSTGDDAGVRKRAHDLRQRLEDLYAGELAGAPVRIELPKGRYAPRFLAARTDLVSTGVAVAPSPALSATVADLPARPRSQLLAKVFWFGFVVGVLAVLAVQLVSTKLHPPRQIVADPGRVFEAEDRTNTFGGEAVVGPCPACSGRSRVKWIGKAGFLTMAVDAPTDGDYMLQIDYLVEGPRTFLLSVNDAEPVELSLRGSSWWVPSSTGLMVRLRSGGNSLRFFNARSYAPDLDRVILR